MRNIAYWLIQQNGEALFLLTLGADAAVSECLQQLLQLGELTQVEMLNSDLHQLYLAAMTRHQVQQNGEAA